jgi:hypothetical protein
VFDFIGKLFLVCAIFLAGDYFGVDGLIEGIKNLLETLK